MRHHHLLMPSFARDIRARQNFPKRCSCGKFYDYAAWKKLEKLEDWTLPWGEIKELRTCPCRSTMSITVKDGEPE